MIAIRLLSILAFIAIKASVSTAQSCLLSVNGQDVYGTCVDPSFTSCTYSAPDPDSCGTEPADVRSTPEAKLTNDRSCAA